MAQHHNMPLMTDPKFYNAFIVNSIPIPEPNECTTFEDGGRLLHVIASHLDFHKTYQVQHEYRTIVLPRLEEQQYDNPPTTTTALPQLPQLNSVKEIWEYATEIYTQWSQYPEICTNNLYEYIRCYLAQKNYLNVSKAGAHVLSSSSSVIPGFIVQGFAAHPHLPIIALATSTAVAVCSVPLSHPVPKLLYHERVREIRCVAFRPNAGNTVAAGYTDGIVIFTQKDEYVAKDTCLGDYHAGSASWVTFLSEPRLGSVSSISWDTYGDAVSGKVGVWRMVGQHFSLLSYTGPVEFVLWSPFDDFLFTSHAYVDLRENRISSGGSGGILNFWDNSNKQEVTGMKTNAAAFSPDGKFVAIATTNLYIYSLSHDKKEIVKCVFIEPGANRALDSTNAQLELGEIENLAWSHDGERMAISFSALPMVALYCVRKLSDSFSLLPIGYVNPTSFPSDSPPHVHSIAFVPNGDRGSVLCICYSDAVVTFTPLLYHALTPPTKSQRIIIPSTRPIVLSNPSQTSSIPSTPPTPLPLSPIPSSISPGHILSPAKATGYRVLFDPLRSPGYT